MKLIAKSFVLLVCLLLVGASYFYFTINAYKTSGELSLSVLDAPVTVRRDALSIPYIEAESLADALRAQGFITGQDRLYQAQLYRMLALGRVAEVFGERGIKSDTLIRLIGIEQLAEKQTAALDSFARNFYTHYIQGLNAYITEQQHEHPLSVKMLGFKPEPWTLQDIIAIQLFQTWSNGSNWRMDVLTQQVIDAVGSERAQEIAQISVNPDDNSIAIAQLHSNSDSQDSEVLELDIDPELAGILPNAMNSGSNAWATGSRKSSGGKPILANSPHLPATTLPGFWHPMGLFTPEVSVVGLSSPASPGIGVGRTEHIAYGATVGGSDGADLYIEQLDPSEDDHYLEAQQSIPLQIREETIRIKDKERASGFREQTLRLRSTSRGPLLSDHGIATVEGRAVSLRWAVASRTTPSTGGDRLLMAKNLDEAYQAIKMSPVALSHVVVDRDGGIGRISSGRVPLRTQGDGSKPLKVANLKQNEFNNWQGLISADEMPVDLRPDKDWVGTANHRIVRGDYPYEFSKIFAVSWRYRRIQEFMQGKSQLSADDHWALINDVKNPMADRIAPLFVEALKRRTDTRELAEMMEAWDHFDTADQIAPTLFQLIGKHAVRLTFEDEFPAPMWANFFDAVYYWQERFMLMLGQPDNSWFDIRSTEQIENRDQILELAINATLSELTELLGADQKQWQWGKVNTITFASPVIPGDRAARWLGGGTHPMYGSGETLNRGKYKLSKAYRSEIIDSVRFVADMADEEKVLAVIPGGSSGRYFDKSLANQTEDWLAGKANVIWFDREKVKENAVEELRLQP